MFVQILFLLTKSVNVYFVFVFVKVKMKNIFNYV